MVYYIEYKVKEDGIMLRNDYCCTAAPQILDAIKDLKLNCFDGYGLDEHSKNAENAILRTFGLTKEEASVHFISGGTQTNALVLSYLLKPYEAVVCCESGHINVHETGAVEASGHKVLTCPAHDGKLDAKDVEALLSRHTDEHMVKPRAVYISDATETGTVYTVWELESLRKVCDKHHLYLFLDGARLGSALTCGASDVKPEDIARVCDAFYVGGTKNGLLYGEAVVLKKSADDGSFRYHIKNRCAMLAKGFVVGAMFERAFTDGLFFDLARHANEAASLLRKGLDELNVKMCGTSPTNQIFLSVPAPLASALTERFGCEPWSEDGDNRVVRAVTSFCTEKTECEAFLQFIKERL